MSSNIQGASGITMCLSTVGLAIGSTASQIARGTAASASINGVIVALGTDATEPLTIEPGTGLNPTAPNSFVSLAAGESCAFLVTVDSAAVMRVVQGPIVQGVLGSGNGIVCPLPAAPANRAVIGAVKVEAATAAFVPGTTNFSAAGVNDYYFNLTSHPGGAI